MFTGFAKNDQSRLLHCVTWCITFLRPAGDSDAVAMCTLQVRKKSFIWQLTA